MSSKGSGLGPVFAAIIPFVVVFAVFLFFMSSSMIQPGYVSIKLNAYGDQKGVSDYPVYTGRVFYNPITTTVYQYPTFTQNSIWQDEERISFNTSECSLAARDQANKRAERERLLEILEQKKLGQLSELSVEDLESRIAALSV